MSVFLFAKQIVDMLYPYKILDYAMVGFILILLAYQIMLVRPDIKEMFTTVDGLVVALSGLLSLSYYKNIAEYETYFKILSAFLMYFVGRIYYERIQECYGALVSSAYIVVYLSFFNRISNYGNKMFQVTNAGGDLHYYDTDMAFAMILAFVFIAMFGKNSMFKLTTIMLVCPYMVFYSDAGIQKVLLLVVIAIILVYIMELVLCKQRISNIVLIGMLTGIIAVVVLLYLPLMGIGEANIIAGIFNGKFLDFQNMGARYFSWNEILELSRKRGIVGQLLGNGLSVSMDARIYVESLYIKTYYAIGWLGLLLALGLLVAVVRYIVRVRDRKTFYLLVIMVVILLGTGVAINSMERVQMSWFPMMFAGMVVSSVQESKNRKVIGENCEDCC